MNRANVCTRRIWALPVFIIGLLCALMIAPRAAHAQIPIPPLDDYGSGTKYVIAFPDTTSNRLDSRYPNNRFKDAWSLFLYSAVSNNRVKIISGGGAGANLTLQAGKFQVQEIKSNPVVTRINSIESNTITIESDYPVIVYCFCAQRQGMEAWTPIPVDMWGTEYNAAALPGQVVGQIGLADETAIPFDRSPGPSEILVMAAYDNTKVTIRPQAWQTLLDSRMPVEVTLAAGQCYQVQSVVDTNADFDGDQVDLGGVSIRADKPIGVVSGNTRTFVRQDQQGLVMNAYKNMLIEWLAPTEQHGTEFVFMPSWDSHRPGINSPNERTSEYVRIYGTTAKDAKPPKKETQFYQLQQGGNTKVNNFSPQDSLREFEYASPVAVYYKTSDPAQAMMHSSSILELVSKTPCFRGIPCQTFDAWAPYMVELTPREQWPSFAPFYAPVGPATPMQHYINVVTDTLSMANVVDETGRAFPFNRKIAGTDLIWGSQSVAPGIDHYLYGKNGAKFAGFVYGFYKGGEQYRPGRTKKKSDANAIAGGDEEIENPLHPCEYEEYNALSYGYPLAPLRKVLKPADSLEIIETMDCTEKTVKIRTLNTNPVGLRSIGLDPTSVVNAKLVPVDPQKLSDVLGRTSVELKIVPLNPLKDASAKLIVKDRTGKIWYVNYVYQAERVDVDPDSVNFGAITAGDFKDAVVTYTNPLDKDVEVKEVKFTSGFSGTPGADGFEVTSTEPSGPAEKPAKSIFLKKGETFKVHLRLNAKTLNKLYEDSLKVLLGCVQIAIPVRGETVEPLIMVNDLNFGTFIADPSGASKKTMDMKVCNIGRGFVTFDNGTDAVLKWLDASGLFTIPQAEIDQVKALKLGPGDCFTLHVSFNPAKTGVYSVTARFFANTRKTKDTSAWTAVVTKPGPQISGHDWKQQWVVPGVSDNCTKNTEVGYSWIIEASNDGSADITVQSISLVGQDATDGYFKLDSLDPATRLDVGESVSPGEKKQQKVIFMPKRRPNPEGTYVCKVRLVAASLNGVQIDTVENFLNGEGIESHGKITGAIYDSVKFAGASVVHGSKTAYVTALPTRPLTITEVRMTGPDAANYRVVALKRPLPTAGTGAWTLQPGETDSVTIEFVPQTFGLKDQAKVEFVGDQAFCDGADTTAAVYGYTFTVGLQTTGIVFGPMLTCRDRSGDVTVANIGSEDVTITDIRRTSNSDFFEMTLPDVPFTVKVGETIKIPVKFSPNKIGDFNETITFDAVDSKGAPVQITPNPVLVTGSGFILTVPAHIDTTFRAYPGNTITTPVILDGELDSARVDNLFIGIRYDNKMLKMKNGDTLVASLASLLTGTILEGWTVRIVESDHPEGEYLAIFTAPPGKFLTGKGVLLNLKFLTYLGSVDKSKINVNILLVGRQCAKVIPTPGLARVDSVCGLNLRLIESTGFDYSLSQNKPNPFNPTTDITFSLGLDGPTTMVVYDASGKQVATLIDGVLKPGTYSVTWNAEGYPSGLYYYRLQSGDWTKTETMILRK